MRMIGFNSEPFGWNSWRSIVRSAVAVVLAVGFSAPSTAQQLTPTERAQIDSDVLAVLEATTAPSASIAIVRGGEIVYERAYGDARIDPKTPATPSMRYAIGSVSKQFTATTILLLQEEGKLSLQDKVATWLPQLTRARDVSVLQRLSMTSGYQDYWPQDYCLYRHATPGDGADDRAAVGGQGAGFRSRHEVAIQQHQLRDRRGDCGARGEHGVYGLFAPKDLHPAEDDVGRRL
jgi:CubicO group peptidase (beta-lactamase class C family)